MPQQSLTFTNDVATTLASVIYSLHPGSVFVLVDDHTRCCVLPHLHEALSAAAIITIPAGEQHKTLGTVTHVWDQMLHNGATRQSLLVNVGGGVITDLGGFCASTFMRGIRFINVPTTILAAVDAAVGGKTGFDYQGLKNEIGTFCPAEHVIISTSFFDTLPEHEILSGYAEMLKHALLSSSSDVDSLLECNPVECDWTEKLAMVEASVKIKQRIVEQDPHEKGLRRTLNLGHTVGHALESMALKQGVPVTHGHAVACGLVAEMVLSHMLLKFPSSDLHRLAHFVRDHYGPIGITCNDYPTLLQLMRHDKKSHSGEINCTLLRKTGDAVINNAVGDKDVETALDIYRDLMGI